MDIATLIAFSFFLTSGGIIFLCGAFCLYQLGFNEKRNGEIWRFDKYIGKEKYD